MNSVNNTIYDLDKNIEQGYKHLKYIQKSINSRNSIYAKYSFDISSHQEIQILSEIESYITIIYIDLCIIYKHILLSSNEFDSIYFAKQLSLTIYEFLEPFDNIINPLLRKSFTDNELKSLDITRKWFSKVKNKLKLIRKSTAHIELDSIKYYNNMIIVFDLPIEELFSNSFKLIEELRNFYRKTIESYYNNNKINLIEKIDNLIPILTKENKQNDILLKELKKYRNYLMTYDTYKTK